MGTMLSRCSRKTWISSGVSNPCLFNLAERDIAVVVHGDDILQWPPIQILFGTLQNSRKSLKSWAYPKPHGRRQTKVRGRIGEGTEDTEVRILNRIVRITPTGVRYEADPRHHGLLVRSMGLEA